MDDKIYAYQLDANGVPQRCFIASNDAVIPSEYTFLHGEPLPITCTIEGGEVIVPVVEVYAANDDDLLFDAGNDTLIPSGNDTLTYGNDG